MTKKGEPPGARNLTAGLFVSVAVSLHDAKCGEGFEVAVGPGERALDVFHLPFAYAAFRDAAKKRSREYAGAA